jgi:Zn-dependent peptidase ImmA (M78 family)
LPKDFTDIQIPYLSDDVIRQAADDFRKRTWGDKIPVDVEFIADNHLNILIIPINGLQSLAHTEAYLTGDLKEINYEPHCPEVRIRFTIAHEIGH